MKTTGLVFVMIGFAVLMEGPASAAARTTTSDDHASAASSSNTASNSSGNVGQGAPVTDEKQRTNAKSADALPKRRDVSAKIRTRGRSSPTQTNRPQQLSSNVSGSVLGNAVNHYQPGSSNPAALTSGRSVQNSGVRHAFSVRPASVARLSTPSLNNVRHRSPNPAIVGGLANARAKNDGAINGTWMHRKP